MDEEPTSDASPDEEAPLDGEAPLDEEAPLDGDAPLDEEAPLDVDAPFDESFERPIDRFRKGAVGSVVAAGLLGIGDALEGRAPKEEVTIVQEAPSQPHRGLDLVLDPEHPERSVVYLPPREAEVDDV
jgi:hypothetical protein